MDQVCLLPMGNLLVSLVIIQLLTLVLTCGLILLLNKAENVRLLFDVGYALLSGFSSIFFFSLCLGALFV